MIDPSASYSVNSEALKSFELKISMKPGLSIALGDRLFSIVFKGLSFRCQSDYKDVKLNPPGQGLQMVQYSPLFPLRFPHTSYQSYFCSEDRMVLVKIGIFAIDLVGFPDVILLKGVKSSNQISSSSKHFKFSANHILILQTMDRALNNVLKSVMAF